jgi:hypothetical protein
LSRPFTLDRLNRLYRLAHPDTFWRHDVDVSVTAAVKLAEWEHERNVKSTYYLMRTSPFYSRMDAMEAADAIADLGHTIGLHIDLRQTRPAVTHLPVSYHCPTPDLIWQDVPAWENANALVWKGRYYSDSRGRFAYGDPEDHQGPWPISLNLHPEWWMEPDVIPNLDPAEYEAFFHEPLALLVAA